MIGWVGSVHRCIGFRVCTSVYRNAIRFDSRLNRFLCFHHSRRLLKRSFSVNVESNEPHTLYMSSNDNSHRCLYVVATPIGNLEDITIRALDVLLRADLIFAEDTRHTGLLIQSLRKKYISILDSIASSSLSHEMQQENNKNPRFFSFHEYNSSNSRSKQLLSNITSSSIATLVVDAGTPLVSDPGAELVRAAQLDGIRVIPLPGACAAIAALSCSGQRGNQLLFGGFLAVKSGARRTALRELDEQRKKYQRAIVLYEAPHRVLELLRDICAELGDDVSVSTARELTKIHEQVIRWDKAIDAVNYFETNSDKLRGEFVIVIGSAEKIELDEMKFKLDPKSMRILNLLLNSGLGASAASKVAAEVLDIPRKRFYSEALNILNEPK